MTFTPAWKRLKDAVVAEITGLALPGFMADIDPALTANSDTRLPTQKAVKAYVDNNTAGIPDDSITNAKLANMPTARVKGRATAGTGDPEDLTGTQVTAMLDPATASLPGAFTAAQFTKLAGIATGATANSADATLVNRTNHTGTQSADTLTDGTTNKAFTATERTKLAGIATGANTGTVTSASVVTANGVSGSVATATTTPAITLTLGAITPSSVAAVGAVTGSNLSGTNTGDQTSVTGNAGTATALATGRTLAITGDLTWNSGAFNGSTNVTAAGTLANTTVTPGTYNLSTITVDSKGRITAASSGSGGTATLADANYGDVTVSASGTAIAVNAGAITLAKQANMATGSVVYRKTAGTGAPEVQTLATLKTDLGLTGTNSGDQTTISGNAGSATILATGRTISLTGDVTYTSPSFDGSGNVTAAATIANGAVTLAKQADMATGSVVYRKTAGAGVPEVQTLATLKGDLGLTGTNSGDQTITLTGAVTGGGTGSFATTLATNAVATANIQDTSVTLAKQANMATASLVYRKTAGSGAPEVQTLATLKTDLAVQDTLVSGTNIKTVGGATLLGSGDAGTIGVPYGGTGAVSLTSGYLPRGNGTSAYTASTIFDNGSGVLLGTTSGTGLYDGSVSNPGLNLETAGTISSQRNNLPNLLLGKASGFSSSAFVNFYYNGSQIGGIVANTLTSVAYNTTSDETLKIDDGELPIGDARKIVTLARIHNFRWKVGDQADVGLFAQELHKIYPAAVTKGGKWQCGRTGKLLTRKRDGAVYVPWMVDYTKLVPVLLRVVQDHEDRLAALEAGSNA